MNPDDSASDDLKDLIDDYLADQLDQAGLDRLESRLRRDPDARRYWVRYCRLHTDLHEEARSRRAGNRAMEQLPPLPGRRVRPWLFSLAAALMLAAVGFGWMATRRPPPASEVAWLVNAQNCTWTGGMAPAGDLKPGKVLRLDRGLAQIRFGSGAQVVLEGPAEMELNSSNGARLLRGKLTANVPEGARGFEILSPRGRVIDLGTEFGISVAETGATDIEVFDGLIEAQGSQAPGRVSLTKNQRARLEQGGVHLQEDPLRHGFVRAITPPPTIVPKSLTLEFRKPLGNTLADRDGRGVGLLARLPGTGRLLPHSDPNLHLDPASGILEITPTRSDLNTQYKLDEGEYLGIPLAALGFTGPEDFEITATIANIPALPVVGQFGLYAGSRSDRNIRGGLVKKKTPQEYTQFMVNNDGGRDANACFLGLDTVGADLRLTLRRREGKYALAVENQTTGDSSTLAIRHPGFLDSERDLHMGVFAAMPRQGEPRPVQIREIKVTVWTLTNASPK
jgi:hypothetical protein